MKIWIVIVLVAVVVAGVVGYVVTGGVVSPTSGPGRVEDARIVTVRQLDDYVIQGVGTISQVVVGPLVVVEVGGGTPAVIELVSEDGEQRVRLEEVWEVGVRPVGQDSYGLIGADALSRYVSSGQAVSLVLGYVESAEDIEMHALEELIRASEGTDVLKQQRVELAKRMVENPQSATDLEDILGGPRVVIDAETAMILELLVEEADAQ